MTDEPASDRDDAEAVLAANRAFYEAFNERDVEGMAQLWAQTADVTCIHPHRAVISGHREVMRSWRAILTNPDQPRIVFAAETPRIVGDIGIVAGREVVAGVPIVATNLYRREAGSWKIIHHHGSPVLHTD